MPVDRIQLMGIVCKCQLCPKVSFYCRATAQPVTFSWNRTRYPDPVPKFITRFQIQIIDTWLSCETEKCNLAIIINRWKDRPTWPPVFPSVDYDDLILTSRYCYCYGRYYFRWLTFDYDTDIPIYDMPQTYYGVGLHERFIWKKHIAL